MKATGGGLPAQRCRIDTESAEESCDSGLPFRKLLPVLIIVGLVAGLFESTVFSASRLWPMPDSTGYITLGAAIAERLDFSHELFQFRTPGYPLLLAGIFTLFGPDSATAILVFQHALVVGTALLSVLIAWTLRPQRSLALVVGVFSTFSLHLSGYANAVLTEVPFAFALTLCVYFLVRYYVRGGRGSLCGAALLAAVSALIRPVGLPMVVIVAAAACQRAWSKTRLRPSLNADHPPQGTGRITRWKRIGADLLIATVPAVVLVTPMMLQNYRTHGHFALTCMGGVTLYQRAICTEGMGTDWSPALTRVHSAVETARAQGWIGPDDTHRDLWLTVRACERVYDANFCDVAQLMGQAGKDVIAEDPWPVVRKSMVYGYRSLFMPDGAYRMQPAGRPGEDDRLAKGATLYAVNTFTPVVRERVGAAIMDRYLPLSSEPTSTTVWWSKFARWYHQRIEHGSPIIGLLDTPYEEFTALAVLGAAFALGLRRRNAWLLMGMVVLYQLATGALLVGARPRHAVPLAPLLHIFAAVPVAFAAEAIVRVLRGCLNGVLPLGRDHLPSTPRSDVEVAEAVETPDAAH